MNLLDTAQAVFESPLLSDMNPQQKLAITTTEGSLLILAGAGSGKTRVVTHRIAYLIEELGVLPWNILAITFTNKAAREMKARTTQLAPYGHDVWISTFHSMCVSILRKHIDRLGYNQNFAILDDVDQLSALKQVLKVLNIDPKRTSPKHLASRISEAKNYLQSPKILKQQQSTTDGFITIYEKYQAILKSNNRLDFDDLLMLTVQLFEQNPDVLEYYQQKFKYIHVDEYQDTNHAQYKMVKLLAGLHQNICVVGDSDQSIYSWRGADITNILSFENDYQEAIVIKLEQNYRSTQHILDAANDVISNNDTQYKKELFSELGAGAKVITKQTFNADVEVEYVAKEIKKLVNRGTNHEEIAILYRTNSQSRLFEQHFMRQNIPYRIIGGVSYFKRKEIKDLVAFLRLVIDDRDDFSLERIINVPTRGIGAIALEKVAMTALATNRPMFTIIPTLAETSTKIMGSKLLNFHELITTMRAKLAELEIDEFINFVLEATGYLAMLKAEDTIESASRIENLEEFNNMAITFTKDQLARIIAQEELDVALDEMTTRQKLEILLADIALQTDVAEEDTTQGEKITLMTVHAAKGLEFNAVFLVGFEDGIFPLTSAIDAGGKALQEERRLAYVAITRAKRNLYITNARMRLHQGQERYNKISRFQQEIDKSRFESQSNSYSNFATFKKAPTFTASKPKVAPNRPKPTVSSVSLEAAPVFTSGDKVTHAKLGDGVVIESDGKYVTIAFSAEHGIKKLMAAHQAIKRR